MAKKKGSAYTIEVTDEARAAVGKACDVHGMKVKDLIQRVYIWFAGVDQNVQALRFRAT